MQIFLMLIALGIAGFYFFGIGGLLIFAFFDRQKDSLTENRVTAIVLFLALIVMPALGIFYTLQGS
jgi:hypothetical protein